VNHVNEKGKKENKKGGYDEARLRAK